MKTKSRRVRAKILLAAPVLAAAAAPHARAEIVYTSVNGGSGLTLQPTDRMFFDLDGQTYRIGTGIALPGEDFFFRFPTYSAAWPYMGAYYSNRLVFVQYESAYISKLPADTTVDGSSPYIANANMAFYTNGPWAPPSSGYAGLRFFDGENILYGWANISYSGSTLTLFSFAYETTGAAIQTGAAVPEPATTALLGALVAGSAAAFAARRKRKLAKVA